MNPKVLIIIGTRPEAIKMGPVITAFKASTKIDTLVCTTGQHKEMLDQVLNVFNIIPDYRFEIMRENQTLFDITISVLEKLKNLLIEINPDLVLVHGDTSTAFISSLASYYLKIKVAHIEAGLRTNNIYSPFPEEFNRQAISLIADLHFSPTADAKQNLVNEGKKEEKIYVTGNTAIDALRYTVRNNYTSEYSEWIGSNRLILLTAHRRENFGEPMVQIFNAIKRIALENKNIRIIYPMHKNPIVREIAKGVLNGITNVKLIEPLDVLEFHNLMSKAYLVLTDSGGIQEEAPSLGIPVIVLREETERIEGINAGTLLLAGTTENSVHEKVTYLLNDASQYKRMSQSKNPYGDGHSSKRILEVVEHLLEIDKLQMDLSIMQ